MAWRPNESRWRAPSTAPWSRLLYDTFAETLASVPVQAPSIPVWSNRTASTYPVTPEGIRAELAAQIGAPVRFVEQIEAMYEAGARTFVEAGPGAVLTRQVTAILGDRPHRTVTLEAGGRTGLTGFLTALAELAVAGADVRTGVLFQGRDAIDAAQAPAAGARAGPLTAIFCALQTAPSPRRPCTRPDVSRRPT